MSTVKSIPVFDISPFILFPNNPALMCVPFNEDDEDTTGPQLIVCVQYVPSKFKQRPFKPNVMESIRSTEHDGHIDIVVQAVKDLVNVKSAGDPKVKLKIFGPGFGKAQEVETEVRKDAGDNAKYAERFMISLNDSALKPGSSFSPYILATVENESNILEGRFSAQKYSCRIPIFDFVMGKFHVAEEWLPLRDKGGQYAGQLHLATQWLPKGTEVGNKGPTFTETGLCGCIFSMRTSFAASPRERKIRILM